MVAAKRAKTKRGVGAIDLQPREDHQTPELVNFGFNSASVVHYLYVRTYYD